MFLHLHVKKKKILHLTIKTDTRETLLLQTALCKRCLMTETLENKVIFRGKFAEHSLR